MREAASAVQRPRVVVTRRLPGEALALLERVAEVRLWDSDEAMPRAELLAQVATADALLCLLTEHIDAELLAAAPRLRVVANMAVGYDNLDLAALAARGVVATHTPGVLTETTADLAFALLLAIARRLPEAERFVREGRWTTWAPLLLVGRDVHGATLGIDGAGRIGTAVARRARGFGMQVLYTARTPRPELEREVGARQVAFDELLAASDFISLHLPLTPETRHRYDAAALRRMRPTAYLVNTARGPLVDSAALYTALREGWIAGAALDVTDPEPLPASSPLLSLPNCLVVPHIGSASVATRTRMATLAAENIVAVLEGRPPLTPIPRGSQHAP
ncbi:MAG TPA: D-glycerate dehydrogenase [Chloroflexota bacterium]|jgi:glyoxylate reductase|nr:D-glycerate dehydrogenase [Chloroflexota bacterium]